VNQVTLADRHTEETARVAGTRPLNPLVLPHSAIGGAGLSPQDKWGAPNVLVFMK
jgi:hypothetical protein